MNDNIREENKTIKISKYSIHKHNMLNRYYKNAELVNHEIMQNVDAFISISDECETAKDYKELLFTSLLEVKILSNILADNLDNIRVFNNEFVLNNGNKNSISPYSYKFALEAFKDI